MRKMAIKINQHNFRVRDQMAAHNRQSIWNSLILLILKCVLYVNIKLVYSIFFSQRSLSITFDRRSMLMHVSFENSVLFRKASELTTKEAVNSDDGLKKNDKKVTPLSQQLLDCNIKIWFLIIIQSFKQI